MSKLIFLAADVRRIVEHSINAPSQGQIADYSKATKANGFKAEMKTPTEPTIALVHDQGVYLMSNGTPRDIVKGESSYIAYAEGCNPDKNKDDWYDNARCLVGGDDFGEYLPWAKTIKEMLDLGATHIVVNYGANRLSVVGKYPKGKAPKGELVKETPEQKVKRLQKLMKNNTIGLDTKRNKLVQYKAPADDRLRKAIAAKTPEVRILNGLPEIEVYKAVALDSQSAAA